MRPTQAVIDFDYEAARRRRDLGAERAKIRADRIDPTWSDAAYKFLLAFVDRIAPGATFLTEQVVAEANASGMGCPADGRAWGSITQKAARSNRIEKCGYAPAATSNCSPKVLWRKSS